MIVKRIPTLSCPVYTMSEAMKIGLHKLLIKADFGKIFITDEKYILLGYYSAEHYKETGILEMQYDTAYLQEDELDDQDNDVSIPMSAEGTDYDILPIVSKTGRVTGAVICTNESWYNDKITCLAKLEYLSEKTLSMEYWFTAKNYRKVAFWGLDGLSLAFANEIRHYPNVDLLGIYEKQELRKEKKFDLWNYNEKKFDFLNYMVDVNFVDTIEDALEIGADLLIVTDITMRHLEKSPLLDRIHTDVFYALTILQQPLPVAMSISAKKDTYENVTCYINSEFHNRAKAKYRALGCNFLTVRAPNEDDLNIPHKKSAMTLWHQRKWYADQNGWDTNSEELKEYLTSSKAFIQSIIKTGISVTQHDFKSKHINFINRTRVVLNAPSTYKHTVYLVGACIISGHYSTDEHTIGYYLQENINDLGLEYRVVSVGLTGHADRHWLIKALEEYDIKEGDKIILFDDTIMQSEWDLDLVPVFKDMYDKYGNDFYCDIPGHFGKETAKAIADFLTDHINDPFVSDTQSIKQAPVAVPSFTGNPQLKKYRQFLQDNAIHKIPRIGSIVMSCDPFTLGHLHLIEYAAKQVDHLYIFVPEEDKSLLSFEDRIELAKAGTSHLPNVKILPSGQLTSPAAAFSTFLNRTDIKETTIDTSLDAETFARHIAPCLNITVRFAGEEPLDPITAQYNQSLKDILPKHGVELCEIPRKELDGSPISAYRVRKHLEEKNWEEIKRSVPETTYSFLVEKFS